MRLEAHHISTPRKIAIVLIVVAVFVVFGFAAVRRPSVPEALYSVSAAPAEIKASTDGRAGLSDSDIATLKGFVSNSTGSQLSYTRLPDGYHVGTATERFARPALSLIKLYIADYVLEHGTVKQQAQAIEMIKASDDETAEKLYEAYPQAIDDVADKYGLLSTRSNESWGYSVTSTYDVVLFIIEKLKTDPDSPLLDAMRHPDAVAADGYPQDFGTSVLPGVRGSKWGWSNDLELHSSVSFGDNYVVAAAVTGSADDLTRLVVNQMVPVFGQSLRRLAPPEAAESTSTRPRPTPTTTSKRKS